MSLKKADGALYGGQADELCSVPYSEQSEALLRMPMSVGPQNQHEGVRFRSSVARTTWCRLTWMLLGAFSLLLSQCHALDLNSINRLFEDRGVKIIARGLTMGIDGDALSCPTSPITTPISLRMMCYVAVFYATVLVLLIIWLLWRKCTLAYYLRRQMGRTSLSRPSSPSRSSMSSGSSTDCGRAEHRPRDRSYVCVSPIFEHGGMLLQQHGYRVSVIGCLVYALVIASIIVSVVLPFLAGFAANSVTPSFKMSHFVPRSLYEEVHGIASPSADKAGLSAADQVAVSSSPQCIKLRVYIFAVCFMWCLAWMIVVHVCRHKIKPLLLKPACLSRCSFILVTRKLQKILLLPDKRRKSVSQSPPSGQAKEGFDLLSKRKDLGEPPEISTFARVSAFPRASGRFAETCRILLVYDNSSGFFLPVGAVHERQARAAALAVADAVQETELESSEEKVSRNRFLETLKRNMGPPDEILNRQNANGGRGLGWSARPVSTLLVASFLQDEFYLVTLMALWYQAFSLNNLQAVILLLLPIFELGFGVYSLRKGEQQIEAILKSEMAKLRRRKTLCLRLKHYAQETAEHEKESGAFVLTRTRASDIVTGDIVLLQPGDEVPCDLLLVHGSVSVDESHLTGETEPVVKTPITRDARVGSLESGEPDLEPARVAEDEVLDPSSLTGNTVGCIYAGSTIVHTSCRGDIASEMLEEDAGQTDESTQGPEKKIEDPAAFLLDDECCWGVAVRTHGETMRGQLLRQLDLPTIIRFKYHAQFPYVLMVVTLFALALVAIQTAFTRSLVDTFRFGVEKLLRMLPLYLPALWGICASLNAKRLSNGPLSSSLPYTPAYRASAVLPGLLPLAAKIRVICFDKTGTLTQSALKFLGTHKVVGGAFERLVACTPEDDDGLIDTVQVKPIEENTSTSREGTGSLTGAPSPPLLQCLACCNSLRFTARGMATWTRKHQAVFRHKYVFTADELRSICRLSPQLSEADIDGVDFEKQALAFSGFSLVEIASSSLAKAERPRLARATTAWAAEMQKLRKTRQFFIPEEGSAERGNECQRMLEIVGSYCFDQGTGMMSVIVRECTDTSGCRGQKGYVFSKGKYEEIAKSCRASSVPPDFLARAHKYAKDGIYVVGAAFRELTGDELTSLDADSNCNILPRSQVESELVCLGLILFRNELRSDAEGAIEELSQGGIRCVMLTGDNPYTAIAVARRARMIRSVRKPAEFAERQHSLSQEHLKVACKAPTRVLLGNAVVSSNEPPLAGSGKGHCVIWTDVNTGEEIDAWRVYYTDEFNELVVTMAAAKILMQQPDTQLLPLNEDGDDMEDKWMRRSRSEALREHEERRALLPHKTDWQSETPSLFDRIFFRIRIFSRMSPMGKKLIILHFQRCGLTTCMVGDGSNDSLAIRQADVGIEMGQVQPAPFSAPFAIFHPSTEAKDSQQREQKEQAAGRDGVRGVVDIIRMGRCSLSTAMAIYRLHISYGLLAATASLLVVMAQYGGLNNVALLFLDIVVLLGLSGSMLFSRPVSGPMARRSPQSSPFGAGIIASVLSLVGVDLAALALLLYLFYGPGGFPPPCYWVQTQLRRALENQPAHAKDIIRDPILKREQQLNAKAVELNQKEKEVEVKQTELEEKEKLLKEELGSLRSRIPHKSLLSSLALQPFPRHPLAFEHAQALTLQGVEPPQERAASEGLTAEEEWLLSPHNSKPLSMLALEAHSFTLPQSNEAELGASSSFWAPPVLQEGSSSNGAIASDLNSHPTAICSTDGHAEAALIFVWTGICTLHAAVLFMSGNVFRKPAWKNRVLLPFSVLILGFFVAIMLLPPSPLTCAFNIKCTAEASEALRRHPLYPVVEFMAADSAASTLHDATQGPATLEAVAGRAAAEVEQKQHHAQSNSTAKASENEPHAALPHMGEAAKLMKDAQARSRHLWSEEEATTLSMWFSHALLYVLASMCAVNTVVQLICLHRETLTKWWKSRPALGRAESLPL